MANEKPHISGLFASLLCLFLVACDAPRKNPLDPRNPDSQFAMLTGTVQTFENPQFPLPGVVLHWKNSNVLKETSAAGQFEFTGILPNDGWLICRTAGRKPDSVYIEWNDSRSRSVNFALRVAPSLSGRVTQETSPNAPIPHATVFWENEHIYTTTDSSGHYAFQDLKANDGWVIVQKENYLPDSVWIEWQGTDYITQNMSLQTMPRIQGQVQTSQPPLRPIANAKVTWNPGNQFTFTDANGNYAFQNPVVQDGMLTVVAEGYKPDSTTIEWADQHLVTQNMFLNAVPRLQTFSIYSIVEFDYGDRTTFKMTVEAKITDQEGDIDSVYIENAALGIKAMLNYDVLKRQFERTFSAADLGLNSIREAVGYDFAINVVDQYNDTFTLGTDRIERVIQDEIDIDRPKNNQSVQQNFEVNWLFFNPEFPFTYTVEVYTNDDFTPDLVWRQTSIPANSLSVTITKNLPANEYFWWIWCVDQFENRSRSKPGSFQVEN